ncbi:MAG: hypothetical protein LBN02_06830 [Oscillospiraceae bacterium]|jgi:hypothetical protein|nr:hypothetical protein [Oscillospiraceae bacterium]
MTQKPRNPNKNGIDNYDASVLISDGARPSRVAATRLMGLSVVIMLAALVNMFAKFDTRGYFAIAASVVTVACATFALWSVVKFRKWQKSLLYSGGYLLSEKYRPSRVTDIMYLSAYALFVVAVVVLIVRVAAGNIPDTDTAMMVPLYANNLVILLNNSGMGTAHLIFFDDRFVAGRYEVSYDGLTVGPYEKYTDTTKKRFRVTFTRNGERVGGDTLYREDYEHLRERLAQTEVHDGT